MNEKAKDPKANQLAEKLARLRRLDRAVTESPVMKVIRDRPSVSYVEHLGGLAATLKYVSALPVPTVVDLGAGSSRAIAEIKKSEYGKGLDFKGIGLIFDPAIEQNIDRENYGLTSAEKMRGFEDASVGGFISVFGATTYTDRLDLVLPKMDKLLVPGGIIKMCVHLFASERMPGRAETDADNQMRTMAMELFFNMHNYGLAAHDREFFGERFGKGTDRIYLAVKPKDEKVDLDAFAQDIIDSDLKSSRDMERSFMPNHVDHK